MTITTKFTPRGLEIRVDDCRYDDACKAVRKLYQGRAKYQGSDFEPSHYFEIEAPVIYDEDVNIVDVVL